MTRAPSGIHARYAPEPGAVYHGWTVQRIVGRNAKGSLIVEVRCECGLVGERNYAMIRAGESKSCGCRPRKKRKANAAFYKGGVLHRDADGSGPRVIHGAKPTPGGSVLTPEVVEHMRRHGVTRIERMEVDT